MQYAVTRGNIDSSRWDLASLSAKDLRGFVGAVFFGAGAACGRRLGDWDLVGEMGRVCMIVGSSSSDELKSESMVAAFSGNRTSFWLVFVVLTNVSTSYSGGEFNR